MTQYSTTVNSTYVIVDAFKRVYLCRGVLLTWQGDSDQKSPPKCPGSSLLILDK